MTFPRTCRVPKDKFMFDIGEEELEHANQYKYLCVNFPSTGKYSVAEKTPESKSKQSAVLLKTKHF